MGTQAERVVYECVQYYKEISITALFTYMQIHVHCNFAKWGSCWSKKMVAHGTRIYAQVRQT